MQSYKTLEYLNVFYLVGTAQCVKLKYAFYFSGIAFPTCVSVNNCICHFSPMKSEADYILKDGDMVKL